MSQMTPSAATDVLSKILSLQRDGLSWREIAFVMKLRTPQEAKKLAKEAARVSQRVLLSRSLELGQS